MDVRPLAGYNQRGLPSHGLWMKPHRVFVLASQSLFAEGVHSLLSGEPGIEVVGVATVGPDFCVLIEDAAPDVVVVEATGDEQGRLAKQVLDCIPGAKVIGLTLDDNRIHTYYQQEKQGSRVEDLVEAIREPMELAGRSHKALRVFVVYQGTYGQRILDNLRGHAPEAWQVEGWRAGSAIPLVVEDPQSFLPMHLPLSDLVLSTCESASCSQLLPGVVERTGARAVIAPVDNVTWLPDGLARQLRAQLADVGVTAAFPKPFCSLTEGHYGLRQHEVAFEDPWIAEFAAYFGRPDFEIECDEEKILNVELVRDSACGCARSVAEQLAGVDIRDSIIRAGLLHHHYPCMATMRVDPVLGEPLIQASGDLMRRAVEAEIAAHVSRSSYLVPEGWADLAGE
jgi:hypothetical protein